MRKMLTAWLVLAGFVLVSSAVAQEPTLVLGRGESGTGPVTDQGRTFEEGAETQDGPWPRERPMLYYEGFAVLDLNRDGYIDQEEYEWAFRRMDTDGDGIISPSEWKAVHGPTDLSEGLAEQDQGWMNRDLDGDGRVDRP